MAFSFVEIWKPWRASISHIIEYPKAFDNLRKIKDNDDMSELYQKLVQYSEGGVYPFHMPGHKRRMGEMKNPYAFDITEIDGFDDLHHAGGILKEAMDEAARIYGARKSYFLVNGSSCGILSAISGCTHRGDQVLAARNCHKSVYHGIFLNGLRPVYVYPEYLPGTAVFGGLSAEVIEETLKREPDCKAVILTSPTYEGVVSDIRKIAGVVHEYHIPLIVDEAHGAHLSFGKDLFPKSALAEGADVVIQSLHKTLPSLTQTAILHVSGPLADTAEIESYLKIYQSSSPSYVLMASIDSCISYMAAEGQERLSEFYYRIMKLRRELFGLKKLHLLTAEEVRNTGFSLDISKLVLCTNNAALSGKELSDRLRYDYLLETEMSTDSYVVLMTTLADSEEGLTRLKNALLEIDGTGKVISARKLPPKPSCVKTVQALSPAEAKEARGVLKPLKESLGAVSKEYLYLYPPGIPLLVPGEIISKEVLCMIEYYRENNLELHGLSEGGQAVWVVE